jgi:hypothetical protein
VTHYLHKKEIPMTTLALILLILFALVVLTGVILFLAADA